MRQLNVRSSLISHFIEVAFIGTMITVPQAHGSEGLPKVQCTANQIPFSNPKDNFEEVFDVLEKNWFASSLNRDAIYKKAAKGLLDEFFPGIRVPFNSAWFQMYNDGKIDSRTKFEKTISALKTTYGESHFNDEWLYYCSLVGLFRELSPDKGRAMLGITSPREQSAQENKLKGTARSIGIRVQNRGVPCVQKLEGQPRLARRKNEGLPDLLDPLRYT